MLVRNFVVALGIGLACAGSTPMAWAQGGTGPDVIVGELTGPGNYGTAGGFYAYSLGTTSCNAGTTPLLWIAGNNQHPVIAQHLYRIKDGRLEQIGISWLKHGFTALQGNECSFGCSANPNGSALGVGCSDPYGSGLNGSQGNGPRSEINATTGFFPYPYNLNPPVTDLTSRRIRVAAADIAPDQNLGAIYLSEGQYVAADDSLANNHHNNASYRRVTVSPAGFALSFSGPTVRQQAAIEGWATLDPSVELSEVIVNNGRFILGTKVTDLANGFWEYEYALYNMNSDRSAGSFTLPVGMGTVIQNLGFHDVSYHSGEPYSGADWTSSINADSVSWTTESFATNPNANAIRWGTLYNFRFQAASPPSPVLATIGLFKPGTPAEAVLQTQAPLPGGTNTPAVSGLTCGIAAFQGSLAWSNGAAYDSILLFRNGQQIATLAGNATSYQDPGLALGSYDYIVNGVIASVPSPGVGCTIDVLPPAPVANLTCSQNVFTAHLAWTNSDPYSDIQIRRNNLLIATLPGTATSYDDIGLNLGTFTYRVTAFAGTISAGQVVCVVDILPPPAIPFEYEATSHVVPFDSVTGQGAFSATVLLQELPGSPDFPNTVAGFSTAIQHDPAYLVASSLAVSPVIAALNGGAGPDFFVPVVLADGITVGMIFSFMLTDSITVATSTPILNIDYQTHSAALAGTNTPVATALTFADGVLGNPPVENVVVVGVGSNTPTFVDAVVDLVPGSVSGNFIRGDGNADGAVNLVDAVYSLNYLFLSGPGVCLSALDVDDNGSVSLADPVTLLGYLFLSGPNPANPFPGCGADPTTDALGCVSFASCP